MLDIGRFRRKLMKGQRKMKKNYFPFLYTSEIKMQHSFYGIISFSGRLRFRAAKEGSIMLGLVLDGEGVAHYCASGENYSRGKLFFLRHGSCLVLESKGITSLAVIEAESHSSFAVLPRCLQKYCSNSTYNKYFQSLAAGGLESSSELPRDFAAMTIELLKSGEGELSLPVYLERVKKTIENQFKENINLDGLAQTAGVGKYKLIKDFKEYFGTTPINFLLERRLEESAFLLESTAYKAGKIGEMAGFGGAAYFTKCFKERYGCTPLEYRLSHRQP